MVLFAAILARDSTKQMWKDVDNYTSYLSQLIYDCQIIVLLYCLEITDSNKRRSLTSYMISVRDNWLLNDTPGPVAELSGSCLLGFEIGRNIVHQAQAIWHSEEKTIVYKDITRAMRYTVCRAPCDTAIDLHTVMGESRMAVRRDRNVWTGWILRRLIPFEAWPVDEPGSAASESAEATSLAVS